MIFKGLSGVWGVQKRFDSLYNFCFITNVYGNYTTSAIGLINTEQGSFSVVRTDTDKLTSDYYTSGIYAYQNKYIYSSSQKQLSWYLNYPENTEYYGFMLQNAMTGSSMTKLSYNIYVGDGTFPQMNGNILHYYLCI